MHVKSVHTVMMIKITTQKSDIVRIQKVRLLKKGSSDKATNYFSVMR